MPQFLLAFFRINSDEPQRPPEFTKKNEEPRFRTCYRMTVLEPRRSILCNDASSWRKERHHRKGARTSASARWSFTILVPRTRKLYCTKLWAEVEKDRGYSWFIWDQSIQWVSKGSLLGPVDGKRGQNQLLIVGALIVWMDEWCEK